MNRILAIALLIGGLILLFFGFGAADSLSSNISETVQGAPSDKSIVLIVLGAILSLVGAFGLVRGRA